MGAAEGVAVGAVGGELVSASACHLRHPYGANSLWRKIGQNIGQPTRPRKVNTQRRHEVRDISFELPYTPEHQLTANLELHGETWQTDLTVNHVSETRSVAGAGPIAPNQRIDARTLVDIAAEYDLTRQVSLFASVQNLTDETYNAALTPAGARPESPASQGGVEVRLLRWRLSWPPVGLCANATFRGSGTVTMRCF